MKTAVFIISICILMFSSACNSTNSKMDKSTVKQLDIDRYLGTWYEIARYDHKFERGLQGVTASYSLRDDGKIKVVNQGYKGSLNGEKSSAVGKAKLTDEPGKLKVSFFWIFYADYFVMELGENYEWALIGSSSDKYLWILSRTPQIKKEVLDHILGFAKKRGYDTSQLIWVAQKDE